MIKKLLPIAALIILGSFVETLIAQELPKAPTKLTLSWTHPDKRANGDDLLPSEISGSEVHDSCTDTLTEVIGSGVTTLTLPFSEPFDCTYTAYTVDTVGIRSDASEPLTIKIDKPGIPSMTGVVIQ